jgi:antitoxin MazE
MSQIIGKWGHSLAVRIPRAYAEQLRWGEQTEIEASVVDGKLIIEAVETTHIPYYSLEELLVGLTPDTAHAEISTGQAMGKEVW